MNRPEPPLPWPANTAQARQLWRTRALVQAHQLRSQAFARAAQQVFATLCQAFAALRRATSASESTRRSH